MLFLAASSLDKISIGDAGIIALLGYATVFAGLILLMIVVTLVGKIFIASSRRTAAKTTATGTETAPAAVKADGPAAPGSAGELKLHDVEPKIAAMLMAIVADKMGKPLNELRFISIKEVK